VGDVYVHDRLTLPGAVVEDGRESASYDCDLGVLTVITRHMAILDAI